MARPRKASKVHSIFKIVFRSIGLIGSLALIACLVYREVKWKEGSVRVNVYGYVGALLAAITSINDLATVGSFSKYQAPFVIVLDFLAMGFGIWAMVTFGFHMWDTDVDLTTNPWITVERVAFRVLEGLVTLEFIFVIWVSLAFYLRKRKEKRRKVNQNEISMY